MKTRFDLTLKHRWDNSTVHVPLDIQITGATPGNLSMDAIMAELTECIRSGLLFGTQHWRIHHLRVLENVIDLPNAGDTPAPQQGGGQ